MSKMMTIPALLQFAESHMKYGLGLLYVVLVALIHSLSSVLVQYIYNGYAFDSPFLLTYIGVSLFTWPLPMKYITNKLIEPCFQSSLETCHSVVPVDVADINDACSTYCQMDSYNKKSTAGSLSHNNNNNNNKKEDEEENLDEVSESFSQQALTSSILYENPVRLGHAPDTSASIMDTATVPSAGTASTTPEDEDDVVLNNRSEDGLSRSGTGGAQWNRAKHVQTALQIAPVWFLANWSYNGALFFTSIASSTVLMSTCSLFAFLFAVIARDEGFQYIKLSGVLLGIAGVGLTAYHDSRNETCENHCRYALLGDLLAVVAALAFGAYAVQIRLLCPRNEELYSMQSLLGYIGLVNMIVLSPFAVWRLVGQSHMTLVIVGLIFVRGLFDYVLSEYLYFRAVVLTNASVATLGLTLTIPLAFGADAVLKNGNILSVASVVGAAAVVGGFLLVNFGNNTDDRFDSDLKESLHEAERKRQNQATAFLQCHAWPCGCLVDKWIYDDVDILVDDNVLPTMYPSDPQHIVNKTAELV
jgi:solute carrier family 35 protein F5